MRINETIRNFKVFEGSTEFVGTAQVTMPTIANQTVNVSGSGIPGEFEAVVLGHTQAMTLGMQFRTINQNTFKLHEQRAHKIELRVDQQERNTTTHNPESVGLKHVFIVTPKSLNGGNVAPASAGDASGEYAVTYWATFIDGKRTLEIDVLNYIYIVNGVDYLKESRKNLGMNN